MTGWNNRNNRFFSTKEFLFRRRIIIGSDRRPETKQAIEGKIHRFRSGRVGVKVMVRDRVRVRFRSPI